MSYRLVHIYTYQYISGITTSSSLYLLCNTLPILDACFFYRRNSSAWEKLRALNALDLEFYSHAKKLASSYISGESAAQHDIQVDKSSALEPTLGVAELPFCKFSKRL